MEAAVKGKVKTSRRRNRVTPKTRTLGNAFMPIRWNDIETFLEANPDDGTPEWALRAAVLTVGWRTLARGKDLANLAVQEIQMEERTMTVFKRFHKGGQSGDHTVRIPITRMEEVSCCPVAMMTKWLERRAEVVPEGNDLLFWSKGGRGKNVVWKPIKTRNIGNMVKRVAREVRGTDVGFGAHSLRKGGAEAMVASGRPRIEIAAIGGWKTDEAMARYLVGEDDRVGETSRAMLAVRE